MNHFTKLCIFSLMLAPLIGVTATVDPAQVKQSVLAEPFASGLQDGSIQIVQFPSLEKCPAAGADVTDEASAASSDESEELKRKILVNECFGEGQNRFLRGYLFNVPAGMEVKGLVLVAHGMQSHSGWFTSGPILAQAGFQVLAFDRRGSGMSDGTRGHTDVSYQFYDDMAAAAEFLRSSDVLAGRDPGSFQEVPMHLHANCFATRIGIPFAANEMEYRLGYRFASIINTAPASHMSHDAEEIYRENIDCLMQYVLKDEDWTPTGDCNEAAIAALRGTTVGPDGKQIKTPLSDELFSTYEKVLPLLGQDELALRELSRGFLYGVHNLTNEMQRLLMSPALVLPGRIRFTQSKLDISTLVILMNNDRMVNNEDILAEYVRNHPGVNLTQQSDWTGIPGRSGTDPLCYKCNPNLTSGPLPAECAANAEKLKQCRLPFDYVACADEGADLVGCVEQEAGLVPCLKMNAEHTECIEKNFREGALLNCSDKSRAFQQCKEVNFIAEAQSEPEPADPWDPIKRVVELDCEHYMEFCRDPQQTQRYREAMIEWLNKPRWQEFWNDFL